jgi:hypothetical protein
MMDAFAEDIDGRKENATIRRFNVERAGENALIRKLKDRYKELEAALVNC